MNTFPVVNVVHIMQVFRTACLTGCVGALTAGHMK